MRFRKSLSSAFLSLVLVTSMVVATPTAAVANTHDAAVANQLAAAGTALRQASMIAELLPVIDGFAANPAMVLGLHEAFEELESLAGATDLEAAINALGGSTGFNFAFGADNNNAGVHTITFDLSANRSYDLPITVMEEDVQIVGSEVTATVTLAPTTITIEYDESTGELAFTNLPTFSLATTLSTAANVPIQFGFAEATASGTVGLNFTVDVTLIDPDGLDRLTDAELTTLAVEDFISLDFPETVANDLDVNLTLTADVFGTAFGGTLTIVDQNLFSGLPAEVTLTPTGANPIDLLTNVGGDSAITALSQLVSSYGVAFLAGDVDLPFLGDGVFVPQNLGVGDASDFDQVFDVIRPLMDYVTPRSAGQIVCGPDLGIDPDGAGGSVDAIPMGSLVDISNGDTIYCRTYTAQNGDASWNVVSGGGPAVVPAPSTATIGVEPTKNVTVAADGTDFEIEVTFTPDDGSGPIVIKQRPETIQDLLLDLAAEGLIPEVAGVPDFNYDADLEAFTFPIGMSVAGPLERAATINAGNSIVADTGLTGLSAKAGGSASVTLADAAAGITLGLIITDDPADINPADNATSEPGPGDRFFVSTADPIVSVGTVSMTANLDMEGRLGFLTVDAMVNGALDKPTPADPALAVSLTPGSVTVKGHTDNTVILIRDLLRSNLADAVNADINLNFSGSASIAAQAVEGLSASGGFDIDWNLNNLKPTISNFSPDYDTSLLSFSDDLELIATADTQTGTDADVTLFETSTVNLLAEPGLVGSQLVDAAGNVCNITAVLSGTQLNCSATDGDVANPVLFVTGETYTVKGNTLSKLVDILAALDGLVLYLEEAVGADTFDTPIDLIGISPSDIVGQIGELRRMIDEFRGVQDAYISCVVQGDNAADIRAIPLDPDTPADVTLQCAAEAFVESPTNVQWRISGDAAYTADTDGDSISASPDPTAAFQALTVSADLDTNDDGFIALGSEYSVEVEWTDAAGDHQAAFPPRVPQSLQDLEKLINETLGLPDGVLTFALETMPADPTLRINLKYGICSDVNFVADCAGMPTGPRPEANLNLDLSDAGLPDLVGLEVTGSIGVDYAAIGQFDVGIPLTGAAPVLYGTTGLTASLQVAGSDDLAVEASIGPVSALVGDTATGGTGNAEATSTTTLTATGAFPAADVSVGMVVTNTTTDEACVISAITDDDNVECALDWTDGDGFELGGRNDLKAGLALEIQLTDKSDADSIVPDNEFVTFGNAGVDIPDLAEVLGGGICGPIDEDHMDQIAGSPVSTDERALTGIACAQLSLAADLAGTVTYLGELDVELIAAANPVRAWVPTDLGTRLGDAALNPAFLLRLLPDLLQAIEDGMRSAADSGIPSAVADPLRTGADGLAATRQVVEDYLIPFADALAELALGGPLEDKIASELEMLLGLDPGTVTIGTECDDGGGGTEDCDGTHGLVDVRDISATFTFGEMVEASTGVNLGLEGLPLSVEGGVRAFAEWGLTIGLGVSVDDGPYIVLSPDAELLVTAGAALDTGVAGCSDPLDGLNYDKTRCLTARIAFLDVEAIDSDDNPTLIGAHLGLNIASTGADADKLTLGDLVSGSLTVTPELAAGINIDLHLRTGIAATGADLPTILGTFMLGWQIGDFQELVADSTFVAIEDVTIPTPTVAFGNLHLDLGAVLDDFLVPITKEIKKITGPLQPIVDVVTAPIPVVSDLAELVGSDPITMISILEAATGADLALIEALAAFITFVNSIPDGSGIAPIPLGALVGGIREAGEFTVDADKAKSSVSPTTAGTLIKQDASFKGGKGFTNDVGEVSSAGKPKLNSATSPDPDRPSTFGVPGLSFPFLEDASQIFGLLVGRDATLIRWDAGTLKASAGMSYDFGPIMVGPIPITITIGGEIGIEGRFAIGYDTSGIRKLLDGGSGTALFDGIFIDDLDANGNDVPEITFFGRVFAGASVDLVIVSAGVRGGIELTFTLDLDDSPDPDGKLRIEEIVDKLQNPICLFVVGGKIEAFLEAFVKIDLFFFSKEFSFELVRITLLEWSSACEPPAPELSVQSGGTLYLNVGERRDMRNIQEDQTDESIEVRQIGANKVRVTGFGWEETREGVTLIVADGGYGDDEILFLPGAEEGVDPTADPVTGVVPDVTVPFTIPVAVSGGFGNDIIKTGDGADLIFGDAQLPGGTWAGVSYTAPGVETGTGDDSDKNFEGDDNVNAGGGDDVVETNGGNDRVEGEFGMDTIRGGDGNDQLNGGPGDDAVLGEGDDDAVHGGPIAEPDPPGSDPDPSDNDALSGGPGLDTVSGDFGNDIMFGDDAVAGFFTGGAAEKLTWSTPSAADWRGWCTQNLTGDFDIIAGHEGNDFIVGGGGDDKIDAGAGNDYACGNGGNDEILGLAGNDELRGDGDNDILKGDAGHDVIYGGSGNDVANGNDGNDDIFGDAGADMLYGDDGNDIVVGDTGSVAAHNILTGHGVDGASIDDAKVLAMSAIVTRDSSTSNARRADCDPETAAAVTGHSDCIFGGNGSDALFGGSDGDFIQGQAGSDYIEGNHGSDHIRGGTDEDLLFGNEDGDDMFGDGADDAMFGDRDIAHWADNDPFGSAVDNMNGGPGADHMEGDGGNDNMFGAADDDHMEGNNGDDTMYGESGNDNMIGGSDNNDAEPDSGETLMSGGLGNDVMAGDNAAIEPGGYVGGRSVTLHDPAIGGADHMEGDAATDYLFGEAGGDTMYGDHGTNGPDLGVGAADYMEGNDGDDEMRGETGDDDMVGGSSATNGAITDARTGTASADEGETLMSGGSGEDWMAGDNARMNRVLKGLGADALDVDPPQLFDLAAVGAPADGNAFGGDTMNGDANTDTMFGQGGNDTMSGGDADDYMEGNDGNDDMSGDAGDDDMVGGGSATNGLISRERDGEGLHDEGETVMSGGSGEDWMAGDNAFMNRVLFNDAVTPIDLFDVNSSDEAAVSGGDLMHGDADDDLMFGQGNGSQGDQSDPPDGGVDNNLSGASDEDAAWLGDIMHGDGGDDYMEGNQGSDLMFGGADNDDMVGGGSAADGLIDGDRDGNGLQDARDTMYGDGGEDWMTGDNALVERNVDLAAPFDLVLFDVNSTDDATSGGDFMNGGAANDRMFGQGNGDQGNQSDPLDLIDNDGDAATDEDKPWEGDVMVGGTGDDYIEGNHGSDVIWGDDADGDESDDGEDDVIGGGSATSGIIALDGGAFDTARTGNGLNDDGDVLRGEGGIDFVAGDNARVDKTGTVTGLTLPSSSDRSVQLFDVELTGAPVSPAFSGGDWMSGGGADDVMFGQGNGAQPAGQADPLDGVDNDLDGREDGDPSDPDDRGYDCGDFEFDNDGDDDADGADSDCVNSIDEDMPWQGDVMFGNAGEDYMEGNHGADWMFGNAGEDDMAGGGSANDGTIDPDRDPMGLADGPDVMHGNGEDDVMTGDNARINRIANGADWLRITNAAVATEEGFGDYDQAVRVTDMFDGDAGADTHGDDYMEGNGGNDEMYGQLGNDFAVGNAGDDALVGDIGQVTANVIGDDASDPTPEDISTNSPHWDDRIYEAGSMWWETVLYAFDTDQGGVGGDDILLGHDGRDTVFGGPGDDIIAGDGDATEEIVDPDNPEFTQMVDPDPATSDADMLFGGDDDDAIWGGRDNDVLMGGYDDDYLDVRPREAGDNGRNGGQFAEWDRDLPLWHTVAFPENFQGKDFIYGGWDQDALQADQAANGPDPGDRLADWAGGFNVFYVCPAGYGDYTILRQGSPHALQFLRDLAEAGGAIGAATDGTSGFRDLAYVFSSQRGQNSHPPHPDHAAHFTCADLSNAE